MRPALLLPCLLVAAGCAARVVTPVSMSQPSDATLDCAALDGAIAQANTNAGSYAKRDADLETKNAVGAILIGAPAIDLTREEQIQHRAWLDRARYLSQLRVQKRC